MKVRLFTNYRIIARCMFSAATVRTMTKSNQKIEGAVIDKVSGSLDRVTCQKCIHMQAEHEAMKRTTTFQALNLSDEKVNISFAGCGFLAIYHLGVAKGLLKHGQEVVSKVNRWGGASAGAIAAAAMVCLPNKLGDAIQMLRDFVDVLHKQPLGALTPGFDMIGYMRSELEHYLPPGSYKLANRKLYISVTRVADGKNTLLTEFNSNEELIEALLCSCYIPVYCGFRPPTFRGQKYIDGGMTVNMPIYPLGRTLCVSPFSGHLQDICPADESWLNLSYVVAGHSFLVCSQNIWRAMMALFSPSHPTLDEYLERGEHDAIHFLTKNGILKHQIGDS